MDNDALLHDLIVDRLKRKFTGEYKEITVNAGGNPDIILANHGISVAVVQVETERSITPQKALKWKELSSSGPKLILMVPVKAKVQTMDLLWKNGIATSVGIGTYEIKITMP